MARQGAYAANGGDNPPAFKRATYHAAGPYQVPNTKVDVHCVHTNHPYGGQMRGPGCPAGSLRGRAANRSDRQGFGYGPIEIRRINGCGSVPVRRGTSICPRASVFSIR